MVDGLHTLVLGMRQVLEVLDFSVYGEGALGKSRRSLQPSWHAFVLMASPMIHDSALMVLGTSSHWPSKRRAR